MDPDINYQNTCRFCLKSCTEMLDIFTYNLEPGSVSLVDFIKRIADLKVILMYLLSSMYYVSHSTYT